MADAIKHFISPSFTYEKLEDPSYDDLVDVLEDRLGLWLIQPALELSKKTNGYIPSMGLIVQYFEAIESYCTGKSSKNKSAEFFGRGFARVFNIRDDSTIPAKLLTHKIYQQIRCGFSHEAFSRYEVNYSPMQKQALEFTHERRNGKYFPGAKIVGVMINHTRFIECVDIHFKDYIGKLRNDSEVELRCNFERAVRLLWSLDDDGPYYAGCVE